MSDSQLSLRDVVARLAKGRDRITQLEGELRVIFIRIEQHLRHQNVRHVAHVKLADGAELAWSGRKDYWRLVIRDGDEAVRLLECEIDEWLEVVNTGALEELLQQLGVINT